MTPGQSGGQLFSFLEDERGADFRHADVHLTALFTSPLAVSELVPTLAAHTCLVVWTIAHIHWRGVVVLFGCQLDSADAMDARDQLWAELIFPWCGGQALLRLRAVCHAFRAQLNASRLWLPFTMELPRMRYDERSEGWPGVVRAIQREAVTRANCDAGRFTRGAVLRVPVLALLLVVGGRLAAFCLYSVQLFDAGTGALVASFDARVASLEVEHCNGRSSVHTHAMLDRWIPFYAMDGRVLLLDCVAVRLAEMAPLDDDRGDVKFSVAGPCVSFHEVGSADVTVMHVDGGPDGATVVWEVARITLADRYDQFALCEGGRSYLLHDKESETLQLVDLATHQSKGTLTPRASLIPACVVVPA